MKRLLECSDQGTSVATSSYPKMWYMQQSLLQAILYQLQSVEATYVSGHMEDFLQVNHIHEFSQYSCLHINWNDGPTQKFVSKGQTCLANSQKPLQSINGSRWLWCQRSSFTGAIRRGGELSTLANSMKVQTKTPCRLITLCQWRSPDPLAPVIIIGLKRAFLVITGMIVQYHFVIEDRS